jgi:phosphoribosylaminoimidazolecarboxamide formyltransferase / IMP cyclohydrolase
VQEADLNAPEGWTIVTKTPFPDALRPVAAFGIRICKHLKSNAILLAWEHAPGQFAILGMGAGQPNRVDALKQARHRQGPREHRPPRTRRKQALARTVLVSDAFFPFADNIEAAAAFGVKYIVEPGGSKKDADCVAACDEHGIAMVFTGCRHFRH